MNTAFEQMTNEDLLALDARNRERLTREIRTNFFVEASAGSGKTTSLVGRMIAMVKSGIPVHEICAITFTRVAASEFYARFQAKLIEAQKDTQISDAERQYCAAALKDIDLCFMGTIDSFCCKILKEHPSEAHIPSDAQPAGENTDLTDAYLREYTNALNGEYGEETAEKARLFEQFISNPRPFFAANIGDFTEHSYYKSVYDAPEMSFDFEKEIKPVSEVAEKLLDNPQAINTRRKADLEKYKKLQKDAAFFRGKRHYAVSDVLYALKNLDDIRINCPPESLGIIAADSVFEPHLTRGIWYTLHLDKLTDVHKRLAQQRYRIAMDFLATFAVQAQDRLREAGLLTFTDQLLLLRDMLRTDAAADGNLIRHISKRHRYFLIDEFQDTNPLQAEIFFYLSCDNPVPDWTKCPPRPGSLFIVGDPKQSIYRFRGADIHAFMNVKELFDGGIGESISLYRNFRSTATVCNAFDGLFPAILPGDERSPKFDSIPIAEEEGTGYQTGVYRINNGSADSVAEMVKRLLNSPVKIRVRNESGDGPRHITRRIEPKDIMVITWERKYLLDHIRSMHEAGIPFNVGGKTEFSKSEILTTLCNLFTCIAQPNDAAAVYGALRSRPFCISEQEILSACMNGLRLNINVKPSEAYKDSKIVQAIETLGDFANRAKTMSPNAVCQMLIDECRLAQCCSTLYMEYVHYALVMLQAEAENGQFSGLNDAATYLRDLASDTKDIRHALNYRPDANRVLITNLHQVKGLEAPIVILAEGENKSHPTTHHTYFGKDAAERFIWRSKLKSSYNWGAEIKTDDYMEKMSEEDVEQAAEKKRLIYVAATRAACLLFISATPAGDKNPWAQLITDDMEDIETILSGDAVNEETVRESVSAKEIYDSAVKEISNVKDDVLRHSYKLTLPSKLGIKSKASDPEEVDLSFSRPGDSLKTGHGSSLCATTIGTLAHRLMESLVLSRNRLDAGLAVREMLSEYDLQPNSRIEAALCQVAQTIRTGGYPQKNGAPQDILGELLSADEVHCELPFSFRSDNNELYHGIMDVIYRKDGKWHIIDYKTNLDGSDLDSEYEKQLNAYRKAFFDMTGETADVHTYHIPI